MRANGEAELRWPHQPPARHWVVMRTTVSLNAPSEFPLRTARLACYFATK